MFSNTTRRPANLAAACCFSRTFTLFSIASLATLLFAGGVSAADEEKTTPAADPAAPAAEPTTPAEPADPKRGAHLFAVCSACHGPEGHGNPAIKAPALAGLTDWYLVSQLEKFRNGQRGAHPADAAGLLMRPMSRTLKNAKDVADVSAYIVSLEPQLAETTIEDGDPAKGQALFAVCIACHGDKLQGNEQLQTAPLKYANDWYMLAQLKKYKAGIRGNDPADAQAAQMKAIVAGLPDEQTMKNVIAYISQLARN